VFERSRFNLSGNFFSITVQENPWKTVENFRKNHKVNQHEQKRKVLRNFCHNRFSFRRRSFIADLNLFTFLPRFAIKTATHSGRI
jgi:hypothetical protein